MPPALRRPESLHRSCRARRMLQAGPRPQHCAASGSLRGSGSIPVGRAARSAISLRSPRRSSRSCAPRSRRLPGPIPCLRRGRFSGGYIVTCTAARSAQPTRAARASRDWWPGCGWRRCATPGWRPCFARATPAWRQPGERLIRAYQEAGRIPADIYALGIAHGPGGVPWTRYAAGHIRRLRR